ncbi:hypothetical protein Mal15_57300 [Stieleria maiorica]|uniref:Uncharacterized protein n=1 Tax=Stieleria maiorica TaxID=2795974 RepID=A0A5B9MK47_9BACT|nr:hypothetical protein Mal15_57300 [Stieleria maiorica]
MLSSRLRFISDLVVWFTFDHGQGGAAGDNASTNCWGEWRARLGESSWGERFGRMEL